MKLAFLLVVVGSLITDNLSLPVGNEGQKDDVVTRCLVEVVSKALSKPDSHPLDPECKDILKAGVKKVPVEDTHDEVKKEDPGVKEIEALLKSVDEKRDLAEDERSQESWGLDDDKEKRSTWRPGRHHQRKHKRDEDEADNERSQEAWGLDKRSEEEGEDREKKNWRPGRYHQRRQRKRDEELSEEPQEDEERSQESWDFDKRQVDEEDREKRIWKPTHRYHHKKKFHKRDEEPTGDDSESSEESEDRDKRNWRPGRYHQRKSKRDEEPAEEEADNERSQESWGLEDDRDKRGWRPGRYHQTRQHKRDEELSEEAREEPDEERSQESWDLDKRYLAEKRNEVVGETAEPEKRNPWIYRGYYHPAWYKRNTDEHTVASQKMEELAKLLAYKMNQLANKSKPEEKRSSLTPQQEKELENLAAMDMELQKIAAKLHEGKGE